MAKTQFLPKEIYRFNKILIKIPAGCFLQKLKVDFKVYMESQRTKNSEIMLKKKKKTELQNFSNRYGAFI